MTLAYLISAYKLPDLLVRLVRRLDGPETTFYIHVDERTPVATYRRMAEPLAEQRNVVFLPRHACRWGDFGHVEATLKGLRAALASARPFDYAVLLTGQDYPLATNQTIREKLERADGQVLMHHFPLPAEHWSDGGLDRIAHRQVRLGERFVRLPGQPFSAPGLRRVWSGLTRRLGLLRDFPDGLRPYGGSSYWAMPRDCAQYVLDFVRDRPRVVDFFRRTAVPDEMMFQTILLNSPLRARVVSEALHWIDWSADGASPAVLTSADFETLMASGNVFARKFDPTVDAGILDLIDRALGAVAHSASDTATGR